MTKEGEIWPKYSLFYYILHKNVFDDERIQKNIASQYLKCQTCLLGQLCNIEIFASQDCIFLKYCGTEEHEIWPKYSLFYNTL